MAREAAKREKRGNGEGSIYQRCDACSKRMEKGKCPECGGRKGRWMAWATLGWLVKDGKKVRDRKALYADLQENTRENVAVKLAKLLTEKNEGELPKAPDKLTVAGYFEYWLGHRLMLMEARPDKYRPKTYDNYVWFTKKHILPALGDIKLLELNADHIDRLCASIMAEGHLRTASMVHQILRAAFNHAIKRRQLRHNPAKEAHTPEYTAKTGVALTAGQCAELVKNLRTERFYALYLLMVYSGVRRAEACGLRWRDVKREWVWDEEAQAEVETCTIYIEQVAEQVDNEVIITPPKTKAGRRQIGVPPAALAVLDDHRRRQEEERREAGTAWQNNDLVFCCPDGAPIKPHRVTQRWREIRDRLQLSDITPHDLRHTYLTLIIEATGDYKTAQELAGHSSIRTTMQIYVHVTNNMRERALKSLGTILPSADELKDNKERARH